MLQQLFAQILQTDSTAILHPWSDNTTLPPFYSPSDIPNTVGRLRSYFPKVTPRRKGGDIHTHLRLGSDMDPKELISQLDWWFQSRQCGMWIASIQAELTSCLGWLLYSTREMDLQVLGHAISRAINTQVGLRWRPISTGRTEGDPKTLTRAIHIEVDARLADSAQTRLSQIYGSKALGPFPLDVRMRLMPELAPHTSPILRTKVERLWLRQAHFNNGMIKALYWDAAALDFPDPTHSTTLRQLVMQIPVSDSPSPRLIHSIDKNKAGQGYIVTFLPSHESEARTILAGLLPYLRYHHPQYSSLDNFFTPAAVLRAAAAEWDGENHCLITADDVLIEELLSDDEDLNLSPTIELVPPLIRPSGQTKLPPLIHEDDSVSTMNQREPDKKRPATSTTDTESTTQHRSQSPQPSTFSSITIDERISGLEDKLDRSIAMMIDHLSRLTDSSETPTRASPVGHPRGKALEADTTPGVSPGP